MCIKWGEFRKSLVTSVVPEEKPHLILLRVKLAYVPNIFPQAGCLAKLPFRHQRGSKWPKSPIFGISSPINRGGVSRQTEKIIRGGGLNTGCPPSETL